MDLPLEFQARCLLSGATFYPELAKAESLKSERGSETTIFRNALVASQHQNSRTGR